jgi:hypothetical protein
MFTKQLSLLCNSDRNGIFNLFMQSKVDAFAIYANTSGPFAGSFVMAHSNNATARVALSASAMHCILLMRHLSQVFNSVIRSVAIDVINLIRRRIFPSSKRPNNAMSQITAIANANADVSATLNYTASNSARFYASLRCPSVEKAIAQLKQAMQLFNRREGFRLGCHLNASEVATGQGVGSTAASQFYTGGFSC